MLTREDTTALIEELHDAATVYYQKLGVPPLSDEEYDDKVEALKLIHADGLYPELFKEGSPGYALLETKVAAGTAVKADKLVHRAIPMLSLDKANTEEQLQKFLDKIRAAGAKDFVLQAKFDGFAISANYENGKLIQLATRGGGVTGEDASYLINHPEVSIVGLPLDLEENMTIEVRGELYFTEEQFKAADAARLAAHGGEPYSLSRNALVGVAKKALKGTGFPATVSFACYTVIQDGSPLDPAATPAGIQRAEDVTKTAAPSVQLTGFKNNSAVLEAVKAFGEARKSFTIPTDGLVIKPSNEAEMQQLLGNSTNAPRSQIAYKYPSPTAITELLGIDLTVGRTGKITPVGRVRTVLLDGSNISNLSLHNFNLIYEKDFRVGQTVLIYKANEIIPQIRSVISTPAEAELIPVPEDCPACQEKLAAADGEAGIWPPKTLLCKNMGCPSRDFGMLKTAVSKPLLNIDGMSEKLLGHLYDTGRVTTVADIYTLTFDELKEAHFGETKDGKGVRLGEKRAQHILNHIEASKTLPIQRILPILSIPSLGKTFSKLIVKAFGDIDSILSASLEDIASLDNMGPIRPGQIWNGLQHRKQLVQTLRDHGVEFKVEEKAPTANSLAGLSFAISGKVPEPFGNRNEWVEYVEANGGEFHSGPKASTSFMVGEETDTSSKILKAKKLGLPIIDASAFTSRFVNN